MKKNSEVRVQKSEAEWKTELTPTQYHVLREKGTERPFTGEYWETSTPGVYLCAGCGRIALYGDNPDAEPGAAPDPARM